MSELKELAIYFGCLALAMASNTIYGLTLGVIKKEFSWATLKAGLLKCILIAVATFLLALIGVILPDISILTISDGTETKTLITLNQLLLVVAVTGVSTYAGQAIVKFIKLLGLKVTEITATIKGETKSIEDFENAENETDATENE